MKTNKINRQKLKSLRKIANYPYGLQKEQHPRHRFRTAKIRFEDFEDHLMRTTALLEVCILALEGEGVFYSKNLSHKSADTSIQQVLELVIELLPHDDLSKYQQIQAILDEDLESFGFPEKLKKLLKTNAVEKEK
ncbi:hypothetical protein ACH3O9_15790 [Leeuwenhoekiella sp. A16]|uniref:hypothetical protein n=1 Tax=unclassified Leeuwenhoekiella TaxID=2615029 RepID=UPI003A806C6A